MVYSLAYRRPSQVLSSRDSLNGDEKQKSINESIQSCNSCMSSGIPPALSFDRIVTGGTCPPVTVRDFMNYLKYIEHSAENLQFFLWFRDYSTRWQKLSETDKTLAPEWTPSLPDSEFAPTSPIRPMRVALQITELLKNTDFDDRQPKSTADRIDPFNTPPTSGSFDDKRDLASDYGSSLGDDKTLMSNVSNNHRQITEQAFDDAGMKWKPCTHHQYDYLHYSPNKYQVLTAAVTTQPFREEISRVVSIYIAEGSPRELNLSARERQGVLHALQHTTHPSAFKDIATTVEYSLRKQAHPNFIRWTICNGNRPRVIFARGLGVFFIIVGLLADLLITLSHASRAWRVLPLFAWFMGISTLIAAWKGMCVVLHGLHHRHLRPWELFSDSAEAAENEKSSSHGSLVSSERNSFEEEPWIPRYKKRNVIRKVFDREIWIQEPALRQIQDTIFLQSILGALVASVIIVGIFCAVPRGNFY